MARESKSPTARLRIKADVLDVRKEDDEPQLVAYAFGQSGKLLGRTELKKGEGELSVPAAKEPAAVRVVVGPPVEGDDQRVLTELMRLDAVEELVRPERFGEPLSFQVDRLLWRCWFRFCLVRGVLLKRTVSGGMNVDLPVCGAEVEIYEVDPISVILPKIPDLVLERLRDLVLKKPPPPPPWERLPDGIPFPPVGPGPGPRPQPAPFSPDAGLAAELAHLRAEVIGEQVIGEKSAAAKARAGADEEEVRTFRFATGEPQEESPENIAASVRSLAGEPQLLAAAGSGARAFRSALLARPELARPILCWLFPPAVTMQLVATATTDDCGKFRALVHVGCSSDVPDLYFRAYRRIGIWRFQLYGPLPVACHTHWNYACGTQVTLITTSPFAHTCPPCQPVIAPDHWVLAMAVGNTSLAAVHGVGPDIAAGPAGTAGPNSAWGDGAPFGGSLRLRFEFDHSLGPDLNVRYYRARWRKVGSGNPFLDLTADAWRHGARWVGSTLVIDAYHLGPQVVGSTPNLFEIPTPLPALGGQWVIADAVVDTTSAIFPSAELAPGGGGEGLYELELALFDAGGAPVNATALGVAFVVPRTVDLTTTIQTANAAGLGLVTPAGRLVFRLYVDNNGCSAAIAPPQVGGSAASDMCGLLRYEDTGDSATLPYSASHPFGHADYVFNVHRGTTPVPAVSTPTWTPVGPPPGAHSPSATVATLLDGCTIAGFAETLYTRARATNGWSRQSQLDASAVRAFALAPEGA